MQYGMLKFKEPERDTTRKILHIDMDAFYASVETRENPDLKGKPVIIARHPKDTNGRGVVTTASYEARKFGVHSAMPAQKAYELCPQGIFIPGRHDLYREISEEIHSIYRSYTDLIEPVSLDEAYLDVTENKINLNSGTLLAQKIQREIYEKVHLTSSAGVSYNKFLAKLASDYEKPAGLTVIEPDQALSFLTELPINEFHGVGEKTLAHMSELGIETGEDLCRYSMFELIDKFGKMGVSLYKRVRGIDDRSVNPDRDRKSVGKEHTFGQALRTEEAVVQELRNLSRKVMEALERKQKHGKTVVLKVRNAEYATLTRRKTFPTYIDNEDNLFLIARDIWEEIGDLSKGIRLLGITVTSLDSLLYENMELPLWSNKK